MKKFIRLTESELKEIIKMVINEQATPEPPYSLSSPKTPLPKSLPLPMVINEQATPEPPYSLSSPKTPLKRQQIIDILKRHTYSSTKTINDIADAILALPLDVPNRDEILSLAKKKGYYGNVPDAKINAFLRGALAVMSEIIKRNK